MTTALKDLCNKELPHQPELQQDLTVIRETLGLLNSMILSGEQHSEQSRAKLDAAWAVLP
jgi:hypothetical protein